MNTSRRLLEKTNRPKKCEICQIGDEWNGKPLSLHADHIDGNVKNNDLNNLRWLCPNCHSQTETYCGKNRKKNGENIKKLRSMLVDEFKILVANQTYVQIMANYGVTAQQLRRVIKERIGRKPIVHDYNDSILKVKNRPSKEILEKLIQNHALTKVGKFFNVSDNTIRKWARFYEIDLKTAWSVQPQNIGHESLDIMTLPRIERGPEI